MDNPNEYDDEEFSEAAIELSSSGELSRLLDGLWKAGATPGDIESEMANAVSEWLAEKGAS